MNNAQRIEAARAARVRGDVPRCGDTALIDLLADLRHFRVVARIDFDDCDRLAAMHSTMRKGVRHDAPLTEADKRDCFLRATTSSSSLCPSQLGALAIRRGQAASKLWNDPHTNLTARSGTNQASAAARNDARSIH